MHFIDCTWVRNNSGVYSVGTAEMHAGCDSYTGGHFSKNFQVAVKYTDTFTGGSQIIFDGTVIEQNYGWGMYFEHSESGPILWNVISLRNVWFEANGKSFDNPLSDPTALDLYLGNIRSLRMDDCRILNTRLVNSSLN